MSGVRRLIEALFLCPSFLNAAGQCGMTDSDLHHLLHFQAWQAFWTPSSTSFRGSNPATHGQEIRTIGYGTVTLLYSAPYRTAYTIDGANISSHTCWHTEDWLGCVTQARPVVMPSVSDAVLGRVSAAGPPVDPSSVCTFFLEARADKAQWHPSPASDRKQQILRLLSEKIGEAAASLGVVRRAVCANFNVDDPRVWAIVDLGREKPKRVLIGIELHHARPPGATVAVVRDVQAADSPLVDRILRDSLELVLQPR